MFPILNATGGLPHYSGHRPGTTGGARAAGMSQGRGVTVTVLMTIRKQLGTDLSFLISLL